MNDRDIKASIFRENVDIDDCAVIALMAVTDLTRDDALDALDGVYRANGSMGTNRDGLWETIEGLGFNVEQEDVPRNCIAAMVADRFPVGRYLIHTPQHVAALLDGDLFNSKASWGDPVLAIARVSR